MDAVDNRREHRSLLIYLAVAYAFTWLLRVPPLPALPRGHWPCRRRTSTRSSQWRASPTTGTCCSLSRSVSRSTAHCSARADHHWLRARLAGCARPVGQDVRAPGLASLVPVALIIAAALSFVPALLAWITGSLGQPVLDARARFALFVPILLQLLTSGLGEEPGWRGYLLRGCRNGSAWSGRGAAGPGLGGLALPAHRNLCVVLSVCGRVHPCRCGRGGDRVAQPDDWDDRSQLGVRMAIQPHSQHLLDDRIPHADQRPALPRAASAGPVGALSSASSHGSWCWFCGWSRVGTSCNSRVVGPDTRKTADAIVAGAQCRHPAP